jgi:omega-amidase
LSWSDRPATEKTVIIFLKEFAMKIALIQMDVAWESKTVNYARAEKFFKKAAQEACDIIVFPEMFDTGFSMNISALSKAEKGETAMVLSGFAKQYGLNVIAGFAVKTPGRNKAKNLAVVIDRSGSIVASYAKMRPFTFADEDKHFSAGRFSVVFSIDGVPASVFICYDLRFPEIFRTVAREVRTIFVIANWPGTRKDHWEALLKARAIENQCFVIGVNRTGKDGNGIRYPGASHIYGPTGKEICAGGPREQFITCEIDPEEVIKVRCRFPFLNDMRPC